MTGFYRRVGFQPRSAHWVRSNARAVPRLLRRYGTAGNLTNDARLAALAIEYNATLYSADHDFRRFGGVDYANPLCGSRLQESGEAYSD
ncbi:PIN domain-containing protein [Wenzhouxiangella sp. EGI_FJ10409]|uniref:PIN domain-containing protein n=1 Tax=Wenzhouxiangella sp. EGI_FJ10409 TaxID=3243767 RepID=UPI0035D62264